MTSSPLFKNNHKEAALLILKPIHAKTNRLIIANINTYNC